MSEHNSTVRAMATAEPRPRFICTETHRIKAVDTPCARCGAIVTARHYDVDDGAIIVDCPACFVRLIEIAPR
jgi:hypothetical protein